VLTDWEPKRERKQEMKQENRERVFKTNWEEVQKIRRKKKAVGRELKRGWTFLYTDLDGWDGLDQSSSNGWGLLLGQQVWVSVALSRIQEGRRNERWKKGGCISLGNLERLDVLSGTWSTVENEPSGPWAAMTRHVEE
jgi:hypothetical protein